MSDDIELPPGDPENYWRFTAGQVRSVGRRSLAFRCTAIHATWIEGTLTLGDTVRDGELHLDRPVVVVRDTRRGQPMVSMVLRRVHESTTAYVQVCALAEIVRE